MKKESKEKSRTSSRPLKLIKRTKERAKSRIIERRESTPHRSFRLTRRSETPVYRKIPAWWRLAGSSLRLIKNEKIKFTLLVALFAPIAWFISGFYSQSFSDFKTALSLLGEGTFNAVEEAVVLFGGFFTSQSTGVAQDSLVVINLIIVLFWLSALWIVRYAVARKQTRLREAIYSSGSALVPFALVLILLVIQLLPVALAGLIFSSLSGSGFTQSPAEVTMFVTLAILLIILSLYLVTSTFIALQIAALPGIYPWHALRNARRLVMGRRLAVLRKIIMLLVMILLGWLLFFTPVLLIDNGLCGEDSACWSTTYVLPLVYYFFVGLTLVFASTYAYVMYRALLEGGDEPDDGS